jgi:hypothetical protein
MIILGLFAWLLALPFNQAFSFWQYILSNTCQISGVHPRRFTLLRGIDNFAVGLERSQPDRWDNRLPRPSISFAILPIMFFLRTHETEET